MRRLVGGPAVTPQLFRAAGTQQPTLRALANKVGRNNGATSVASAASCCPLHKGKPFATPSAACGWIDLEVIVGESCT